MIKIAFQDKLLNLPEKNYIESTLKLNNAEARHRMSSWEVLRLNLNKDKLLKSVNSLYQALQFNPFKQSNDLFESPVLRFFKYETKEFVTFDIISMQDTSRILGV